MHNLVPAKCRERLAMTVKLKSLPDIESSTWISYHKMNTYEKEKTKSHGTPHTNTSIKFSGTIKRGSYSYNKCTAKIMQQKGWKCLLYHSVKLTYYQSQGINVPT